MDFAHAEGFDGVGGEGCAGWARKPRYDDMRTCERVTQEILERIEKADLPARATPTRLAATSVSRRWMHGEARGFRPSHPPQPPQQARTTSLDAQGCVETGSTYSGMRAQVAQGVAYQRRYARSNDPVIAAHWLVVA